MKRFETIYEEDEINKHVDEIISAAKNEDGTLNIQKIEEGIFGKVIGGVAGFTIGPSVGRIIAKALGIEKGIIYDLLTSRLVGTALGTALLKGIKKKK